MTNLFGTTNVLDEDEDDDYETISFQSNSAQLSNANLSFSNLSLATSPTVNNSTSLGALKGASVGTPGELFLLREEGKPAGLRNVGNTCWFNSIIQVIF